MFNLHIEVKPKTRALCIRSLFTVQAALFVQHLHQSCLKIIQTTKINQILLSEINTLLYSGEDLEAIDLSESCCRLRRTLNPERKNRLMD